MGEKIIKLDDTETEENEFDQYKSPISKNTIDKIRVSNTFPFGKQHFKYFSGYKDNKKLNLSAYSFQKRMHIK